jgi:ferredoxin
MGFRLTIDHVSCTHSGLCTHNAPMLVRTEPDGSTAVIQPDLVGDLRWVAEEAVQRCPSGALTIERTND